MKSSAGSAPAAEEQPVEPAHQASAPAGKDKSKSASETNDKHNKPSSPVSRQPRRIPARPSLLRQPVLLTGPQQQHQQQQQQQQQTIELASVTSVPRRPARLPAAYASRYSTLSGGQVHLDKPNRYSWAQRGLVASQLARSKAAAAANAKSGAHFSAHLSSAASRVFVVNPMHIVNLSEHTKSRLIKIIEALKRFSEKWFSHVLLLLFLAVYACFGAYIFLTFEAPTERAEKQLIIDLRNQILNGTASIQFWPPTTGSNVSSSSSTAATNNNTLILDRYNKWLSEQLLDYELLLTKACASGITSSSLENQWNFWGALFYSMTVFTTIGYGQLAPITFSGRVATVAYAIFGIPILLMVLADLGKLLTRIIKFTFRKLHHLYSYLLLRKSSVRTRRLISRTGSRYKRACRVALTRWLNHITNYLRPPERLSGWLSRFRRKSKPADHEADTTNPMTTSDPSGGSKESVMDAGLSNGTEVIVTPAKQTKPVSPQPGMHLSSPTGLIAGSVTNESRAARHRLRHHHSRNLAAAGHPHSHHAPAHHLARQHRSQSPGQSGTGSSRRKNSLASAKHLKGSVSRSSSSSMVMQQSAGGACLRTEATAACKPATEDGALARGAPEAEAEQEEREDEEEQAYGAAAADELYEAELDELIDGEEDEDFDIPVSFALFLLVAYMILGASLFGIWEGWDFFSSLYFVFISMSTIGFGDLVPKQQPKRMIGTFIYLLFGLALTSMCINVVQEKIHATFLRAKMQIGEKMGLDLDQIMADDYYEGSLGPDDYDCLSVTPGSQADSCTLHPSAGGCCECCPDTDHQHHQHHHSHSHHRDQPHSMAATNNNNANPSDTSKSVRLSRGSSSLRSRPQVRAGHSAGYSIPFLRKPSAKRAAGPSKQATTCCVSAGTVESSLSMPSTPALGCNKLAHEEQRQPPFGPEVAAAANKCPAPLVSGRARLHGTNSQPSDDATARSQSAVCKSLSSELAGSGSESRCAGAHSAGSSRRSSVSQELNQLDDIIQTLGKSARVQRFGPLLGIPVAKSRRPGRASTPSQPAPGQLAGLLAASSGATVHRRAASVSHGRRQQVVASPAAKPASAGPRNDTQLASQAAESTRIAIEELEAVKVSLT